MIFLYLCAHYLTVIFVKQQTIKSAFVVLNPLWNVPFSTLPRLSDLNFCFKILGNTSDVLL